MGFTEIGYVVGDCIYLANGNGILTELPFVPLNTGKKPVDSVKGNCSTLSFSRRSQHHGVNIVVVVILIIIIVI